MKKVKMITSLLLCISVLLCACGTKKLEGRPSAVVDQAQDLKNGEKVNVVVSGFVADSSGWIILVDEEDASWSSTEHVFCNLKDESDLDGIEKGDRVTIAGELTIDDGWVESDNVTIFDCTIE